MTPPTLLIYFNLLVIFVTEYKKSSFWLHAGYSELQRCARNAGGWVPTPDHDFHYEILVRETREGFYSKKMRPAAASLSEMIRDPCFVRLSRRL